MSNAIKNLIQQSKIAEASLFNSEVNLVENMKRRASVTSFTSNSNYVGRKKSTVVTSGSPVNSTSTSSSYRNSVSAGQAARNAGSIANLINSAESGSSSPNSPFNLNEVYVSPTTGIIDADRRVSAHLIQQQQINMLEQKLHHFEIAAGSGNENKHINIEEKDAKDGGKGQKFIPALPPPLPPAHTQLSTPSSEEQLKIGLYSNLGNLKLNFENKMITVITNYRVSFVLENEMIRNIDETSAENDNTESDSSISLRERL